MAVPGPLPAPAATAGAAAPAAQAFDRRQRLRRCRGRPRHGRCQFGRSRGGRPLARSHEGDQELAFAFAQGGLDAIAETRLDARFHHQAGRR